ncbi:hypothetical protein ABZP36_032123 [Zizania latifolia]
MLLSKLRPGPRVRRCTASRFQILAKQQRTESPQMKGAMGSYPYTSTSRFFFAAGAGDSDHKPTATPKPTTVRIPVTSPPPERSPEDAAAARIQAAFRGHLVRRHAAAVRAADAEASRLERLLRRQETVDAVRGDERERARFSEALMAVLLRLGAVPGYYPAVREARRAVTRRVVGLQEVFDSVLAAPEADTCGVPASLDQILEGIWGAGGTPAAPPPPVVVVEEEEVIGRSPCWRSFFRGL